MGKRYYDNYDYEEAYKEQCKKLEEAEMERWMKEGWVNCLYRTSTYKSTNTESNTTLLESMVYPSFKFKWFKEKQTELSGDIAGKLQLQIDDVKEKVYNIAFKVYIISTLEQITSPVTVKLTNKTTGTMQTVTVTKSQMGFYVTEAGEYTVEADLESVMVTPKAFKVTNDNLMTTQNITLREGSNMGYIGNYIGSFIAQ